MAGTDASRRQREEKLIEMLVNSEFPVKKRSKTSEEILCLNVRNHGDKERKLQLKNGNASTNKDSAKPIGDEKKVSPQDKDVTEKKLNKLFKEMDKMEGSTLLRMDKTVSFLGGNEKEIPGQNLDSTISIFKTKEASSRSVRVIRSVALKVPPLDARLLTDHSVLVGDLSIGRNFKILGNNGERVVDEALAAIGWQRLDEFPTSNFFGQFGAPSTPYFATAPVHLTWADSPSRLRNAVFVEAEEMVNHVPNMALLSDKIKLFESLTAYERQIMGGGMRRPGLGIVGHIKMDKFVPRTFRVDVATDRTRFYREFQPGQIWICKPASENCGRGIFLVRSLDEFHTLLTLYAELKDKSHQTTAARSSNASSLPSSSPPTAARPLTATNANQPNHAKTQPAFHNHTFHRVVQRYIENPLLVNGRKLDLRAYLLVASTDPYVVLFRPGYVRLAMDQYDSKGKSPFSHLTNQCVQKKHPEYQAKKDESVWTMSRFNDFINDVVAPEVGVSPNWAIDILPTEMKKIMVQCFQSIRPNLPSTTTNGRFELLGIDFMLDDKLNLWLIEVNVNPALATNNATLAAVIPPVVQEALYIAIECFEKQKVIRGPLSPLHTCKEFQIIYEEYSSSKWIFGQNPSPRWNPSFVYAEEEKARLSVARRQALCPRVPLGASLRGKWAAPHEENSPGAICAIASTRHLIQTMRDTLDARDKETKKREEEEERKSAVEEEAAKRNSDDGSEEEVKWLRERWR